MAPSTPGKVLDHGCGSSLPNVAGMLGREGDGAGGGFATGGCSALLRFNCRRRGKFHVQEAERPLDSHAWQIWRKRVSYWTLVMVRYKYGAPAVCHHNAFCASCMYHRPMTREVDGASAAKDVADRPDQ